MNRCEGDNSGCGTGQINIVIEKSLIIIKPDGIQNRVIGKIISRFEEAGFSIERLKMIRIDEDLAVKHYKDHVKRDFFEPLLKYICSGPVIVMVVSGPGVIEGSRKLMGPTDSKKAPEGTIRGDFGKDITINVIHGSDSPESADREIKLFFNGE